MAYVPISVSTPPVPVSPRTRELAGLLNQVLEEYQKAHPATTKTEVKAALKMTQMSSGTDTTRIAAILSLVVGLLMFGVFAGLIYFRSAGGGEMDWAPILPGIIMGIIAVLGVAVVAIKMRS